MPRRRARNSSVPAPTAVADLRASHLAVQARIELARAHLALADLAGARTLMREVDDLLRRCRCSPRTCRSPRSRRELFLSRHTIKSQAVSIYARREPLHVTRRSRSRGPRPPGKVTAGRRLTAPCYEPGSRMREGASWQPLATRRPAGSVSAATSDYGGSPAARSRPDGMSDGSRRIRSSLLRCRSGSAARRYACRSRALSSSFLTLRALANRGCLIRSNR
jgi:hypothetical protein